MNESKYYGLIQNDETVNTIEEKATEAVSEAVKATSKKK